MNKFSTFIRNKIIKLLALEIYSRKKLSRSNKFGRTNKFGAASSLSCTEWGQYSGCNKNCDIVNSSIGNFTSIASNVIIGPRDHILSNFTTHDFVYTEREHSYIDGRDGDGPFSGYFNNIGHDVWIGTNSIILQGVEIGNGAIVAAGSIVSKSVPPYAIVGGVPAKLIKYRFSQEEIKELEQLKWYLWDLEKILLRKEELSELVDFDLALYKKQKYKSKKKYLGQKHI